MENQKNRAMTIKAAFGIFMLIIICGFTNKDGLDELRFLEGTWKIENKENYETWKMQGDTLLEGRSYKIRAEKKTTTEFLAITKSGDQIIYTATVPGQNEGRPVDFILNKALKNKFSFENPGHDFPKKIQYTLINKATLFVEVLGEGDKGFSYRMTKQD